LTALCSYLLGRLPSPTYAGFHSHALNGTNLFVVGGASQHSVSMYDTARVQWVSFRSAVVANPDTRRQKSVTVVHGRSLLVFGGTGEVASAQICMGFSLQSFEWFVPREHGPRPASSLAGMAVVRFNASHFFLFGTLLPALRRAIIDIACPGCC
jgi:hypothetical protein